MCVELRLGESRSKNPKMKKINSQNDQASNKINSLSVVPSIKQKIPM